MRQRKEGDVPRWSYGFQKALVHYLLCDVFYAFLLCCTIARFIVVAHWHYVNCYCSDHPSLCKRCSSECGQLGANL